MKGDERVQTVEERADKTLFIKTRECEPTCRKSLTRNLEESRARRLLFCIFLDLSTH